MKTLLLILSIATITASDNLKWNFDFVRAKSEATVSDKKILVVFSGSDWCKPCIQLHKQLFESEAFAEYATEHLILVKADFPYRKKNRLSEEQTAHNEELARIYNPNGEFPLAVFTDEKGKFLGAFGYDKTKSPETYIQQFNQMLK